jgi:hypothetical protein
MLATCLVWGFAADAAVIKSVQTGTVSLNANPKTVAITAVNTAKAFVICTFNAGGNGSNASERVTCELTNATTVTITNGATDTTEAVRWYVVEFLSGVTVQRGLKILPTGATTTNVGLLTNINLAKTFVLVTETTAQTSQTVDERFTVRARLTAVNNLELFRNANTTDTVTVAWQVVQIDESAVVQSGLVTIAAGNPNVTAALNPPVDLTRTFLVFSRSAGTSIGGDETLYQITGEITNATTLTFTKGQNGGAGARQMDIAWFAVRMTDSTTVQKGSVTPASAATATVNVPITAIVINRSIPLLSVRITDNNTPTADLDDAAWSGTFTTTTNLQLTKTSSNSDNSVISWQVVQFNNAPNIVDGDGREIFP